ncbi:hypothetical protein N0V95_007641 [Ascochyta clinopodiicola]|nr:hypothetical protein N0V95_007641 [Ascochyta clinopodiicola]
MLDLLKLHTQDLVDVMVELDRSDNPRSHVLHELAEAGRVHSLDEKDLGPLRKTGTVFHRNEWASPVLSDQHPFENMLNTDQIKAVLLNEIGGENGYSFSPVRHSPEEDAQAIVELLNNIGNPSYSEPGSIPYMESPTFEHLCQHKADWPSDGMLGVSPVTMTVAPAGDFQDVEYYDTYTLSTLLTGTKVWFAYPPLPDNLALLQAEYKSIFTNTGTFAMEHLVKFQHGIAIIQQTGQTLVLPPFWMTTCMSTQTSVSSAYHVATAMVFADRIKYLGEFLATAHLWPAGAEKGQRRLVMFATDFIEHLQEVLANSFPHYNASKLTTEVCRQHEVLRNNFRRVLEAMEDKAVARGLENKYRAAWLTFLEKKRQKSSACRLCKLRTEQMPAGGTPTDRLRQHFNDFHCLRSEHVSHGGDKLLLDTDQKNKIATIMSSNIAEDEKIDELAKIRGWFRPQENSPYYPTIQKYLSDEIDLETAARTLFTPIDEKIAAQKLDDVNFLDLWYSILHSARRKTFHSAQANSKVHEHFHAKVADLIGAFRTHTVPGHEQYNYLYTSLTDLSLAFREAYNDVPTPADASTVEIDAWANLNFFYARVTEKRILDLSIHAIWSMRAALETPAEDDAEGTAAQKYDVHVPAAAAWIFGMGRMLWHKEEDLTPKDRKQGNPARGGELWKGVAGFSKERWGLWKERLAVISEMDDVVEKTRYLARDAIEGMERAESFSNGTHSAKAGR